MTILRLPLFSALLLCLSLPGCDDDNEEVTATASESQGAADTDAATDGGGADETDGSVDTAGATETDGSTDGEQQHLVLNECGLDLVCDPLTLIIDYFPAEAYACASERWASGGTGRLSILHETDGDAYIVGEDTLVLLPEGQILRQHRDRDIGELENEDDDVWLAWGEHELCENNNDTFAPEANFSCELVADWTCAELLAAVSE